MATLSCFILSKRVIKANKDILLFYFYKDHYESKKRNMFVHKCTPLTSNDSKRFGYQ